MRGKDLLEDIEYIDDELIDEAADYDTALSNAVNTNRGKVIRLKYLYTAAAFAVILGASALAVRTIRLLNTPPLTNEMRIMDSAEYESDNTVVTAENANEDTAEYQELPDIETDTYITAAESADMASNDAIPDTTAATESRSMAEDRSQSTSENSVLPEIKNELQSVKEAKREQYTIIDSYNDLGEGVYAIYCYAAPEKGEYFYYHYLNSALGIFDGTDNAVNRDSAKQYAYKVRVDVFGDTVDDSGDEYYTSLSASEEGREKLWEEYERLLNEGYDVSFFEDETHTYIYGIFTREELDNFEPQPEYGYTFGFLDED